MGPLLGPYCCAAASFKTKSQTELFALFSGYRTLQIGDSKKIYKSGKSVSPLEKTALSFLLQKIQSLPENLQQLLGALGVKDLELREILSLPWFEHMGNFRIPAYTTLEEIENSTESLRDHLSSKKIQFSAIHMDVVPAIRFNRLLSEGKNKSQVCLSLIAPLLSNALKNQSRITVDRQGGMRYYGQWLLDLFPGRGLTIRQETAELSRYDLKESTIQFQVKGDAKYMETALASIFSKYIRELMMDIFNQYWTKQIPGLKKTAGYPQDGKRFITDLNRAGYPYDKKILIRQK